MANDVGKGVGVSLHPGAVLHDPDALLRTLERIETMGFTAVELPIQGLQLIVNGVLQADKLERLRRLLAHTGLQITTHAPFWMNLFAADRAVHRNVLEASLEITAAIGASCMAYHPGRFRSEELFLHADRLPPPSEEAKRRQMREERDALREIGERARRWNVRIGMENMRPYLDDAEYCYAVHPTSLAEQAAAVDHPNIGITLDTGHLYLYQQMHGLDLKAALEPLLPHIVHVHVHDNFGKPCYSTEKDQYELLCLGRGDMHLPIGRGRVPMQEIAALLGDGYQGILIHEVRERYEAEWATLPRRYTVPTGA